MALDYLVQTWGGFYNPEHKKIHKLEPGCYWFDSLEDVNQFKESRAKIEHLLSARVLCFDIMQGEYINKKSIANVIFEYNNTQYKASYHFHYGYGPENAEFYFFEGNFGCDCNRSIMISQVYPSFKELDCGDDITIVKFDILLESKKNPLSRFAPEQKCSYRKYITDTKGYEIYEQAK